MAGRWCAVAAFGIRVLRGRREARRAKGEAPRFPPPRRAEKPLEMAPPPFGAVTRRAEGKSREKHGNAYGDGSEWQRAPLLTGRNGARRRGKANDQPA